MPADSTVNQAQRHDDPFFEAYRFIVPGYNVRPLELCGAVGIEQLKKLDGMLDDPPRRTPRMFVELFEDDERFIIQRENGSSSWFSFTLILNPAIDIDRGARHGRAARRPGSGSA